MCKDRRRRGSPVSAAAGPRSGPVPSVPRTSAASTARARRRYQDLRRGHVTTPGLMPIGRRRSRDVPVFVGLLVSGFRALPVARDEPSGGPLRRAGGGHLLDITDESWASQTLVNTDAVFNLASVAAFCSPTSFRQRRRRYYDRSDIYSAPARVYTNNSIN